MGRYWELLYPINGFGWSRLCGDSSFDWSARQKSAALVIDFKAGGVWYFRKMERSLAGVI
ncbi:MAG TPA: hypothetical protein VGR14_11710 [Verrucomicrobiae bacterium]|nr:hypothetical protein [Verrucomicrobiae bacterium]